jgi:hypothetical protein
LTPAERILLTWQLSLEQWEFKGSKAALIKNKLATGRPKDLVDLDELERRN